MNKIAFIIPYFGHFNNYFQLYLNSCKYNENIDWLIFTDDHNDYKYPSNVIVRYCTIKDIKELVQKQFDFTISLDYAYKLCDYRPAYGLIFSQFLEGYQFWGYCDSDLIWGRIDKFITNDILDNYDKIGIYGHCTLFRNSAEINSFFKRPLNGIEVYKKVFTESWNHSFDEEFKDSINNIFEDNNKHIYYDLKIANIYMKSSDFRLVTLNAQKKYNVEKQKQAFFVWDKGKLSRYTKINGKLQSDSFAYIHMQSRPMKNHVSRDSSIYKIIPNAFETLEVTNINAESFERVKIKHINLHYFRLRSKNLMVKIKRKIRKRK